MKNKKLIYVAVLLMIVPFVFYFILSINEVLKIKVYAYFGNAIAERALGYRYYVGGMGVNKNPTLAMMWLEKAANKGEKRAEFYLANIYCNDELLAPRNYHVAFIWAKKSAEHGLPEAQNLLGNLYWTGDGGQKNIGLAIEWWQKAAKNGETQAQYNLGTCYRDAIGVSRDYKEAVKWFKLAANSSNDLLDAMNSELALADLYYSGKFGAVNYSEAIKWYKKAADQNNPTAQVNLAFINYYGKGIPVNYQEAAKWVAKAANNGDAKAALLLSGFYEQGIGGVAQNRVLAYMWALIARAKVKNNDYSGIEELIQVYSTSMSLELVQQSEQMATEWLSSHSAM
jgi:hypothetical protein